MPFFSLNTTFHFKRFSIQHDGTAHPVGTDGVLLGAWATIHAEPCKRILDIGSGTGLLALMLAQRTEQWPECRIDGVELQETSYLCSKLNFEKSPWAGRLRAHKGAVQEFALQHEGQYDLIVSNPPFFEETTVAPLESRRLVRQNGSLPPLDLVQAVLRLLAPNGRFYAVLPPKEGQFLCELAATQGLYFSKITKVRARADKKTERLLIAFQRETTFHGMDELVIHSEKQQYSTDFKRLTMGFYL